MTIVATAATIHPAAVAISLAAFALVGVAQLSRPARARLLRFGAALGIAIALSSIGIYAQATADAVVDFPWEICQQWILLGFFFCWPW